MPKKKLSTSKSSKKSTKPRKLKKTKVTARKTEHVAPITPKVAEWFQKNSMTTSGKIVQWLDRYLLLVLTGFLFAFIPLYPKIPLADVLPGYIVRLRLEDIFVAATALIFFIQFLRKKVEWNSIFTVIIVFYAIVGLLSTLSAVFITKTVPLEFIHVGKTMLHYFRYLEYFSLFFFAYSSIKKRRDVMILLGVFAFTVLAISIYGYGQKYYYWPVYSTMNREFSKGMRLYLTEHARVQSTFGGHYDMAAYLVIALPVLLAIAYETKRRIPKIVLFVSYFAGVWLIIMSASRTSFAAMLAGIGIVIGLVALEQQTWLKKIWWGLSRGLMMFSIVMYMFFTYGDSIYERFLQTLKAYPELNDSYHLINDKRRHFYRDNIEPTIIALGLEEMKVLPKAEKPKNGISLDEVEQQVMVSSDQQPTDQPPSNVPADVYVDVPDYVEITTESGGVKTTTITAVPRTYSDSANKYGLSMAIRLDTLWPRALQGFYTNPILGSGYATLTKESVYHFTEADSTDNNFLRTLGETGLLGFLTFYGMIVVAMGIAAKAAYKSKDWLIQSIAIGYIAASVGLLLNAIFIDVYAASKVAFTYWLLTGIVMATIWKLSEISLPTIHLTGSMKNVVKKKSH